MDDGKSYNELVAHTALHHLLIVLRALVVGIVLLAVWGLVFFVGLFFWTEFSAPLKYILGLPLVLLGTLMGLVNLFEMLLGLISWRWGREHCPFCPPPEEVEEILSPQDGFK